MTQPPLRMTAAVIETQRDRAGFVRQAGRCGAGTTGGHGRQEHVRRGLIAAAAGVRPGAAAGVRPIEGHHGVVTIAHRMLDRWADDGTAEPSAVNALRLVDQHTEWLDLRGRTVVVMGAGAEMGPYEALLGWGAHVVAVDLPGVATWQRLIDTARRSPGRLTLPVRRTLGGDPDDSHLALAAGADVVTEAPEVAEWLMQIDGPFIVGDYVYAPGAAHVRTSAAVDAIVAALLDRRPDVGLAYLATPTDAYAVPSDAVAHALKGFEKSSQIVAMARGLAGRRVFRPNYAEMQTMSTGRRFGLFDGLITQQGPNYALAKRIQQWRALRARESGVWVSINVAPATRTQSVVNSSMLEAAYGGSHRFGLRVFAPQASRQVMAALLVHDLHNASVGRQPRRPARERDGSLRHRGAARRDVACPLRTTVGARVRRSDRTPQPQLAAPRTS